MRTLLISDLHLGHWNGRCVLERPRPLERLQAELSGIDRLILLGDIVELRHHDEGRAMVIAEPVLRAIAAALGPEAEICLIPGNHDRRMIRPWIVAQGRELPLEGTVPHDTTVLLATVTSWLASAGARVSVSYPGLSLSDRVWVTHGHYLDRLLTPQVPYGRRLTDAPVPHRRPADYEFEDRMSRTGRATDPSAEPSAPARVLLPLMSRLISRRLGNQMRRHSVPALRELLSALGVDADYVVFGHVHRNGPLGREDWGARPRLLNTGSWFFEPVLLSHAHPPDPYWPGGAVRIDGDGIPRPINLLNEVTHAELRQRVR